MIKQRYFQFSIIVTLFLMLGGGIFSSAAWADSNNSCQAADSVSIGDTIEENIGGSYWEWWEGWITDSTDYFSFSTRHPNTNLTLQVTSESTIRITISNDNCSNEITVKEGINFSFDVLLTASATYQIRVDALDSGAIDYAISLNSRSHLLVDDDKKECSQARYSSIEDALLDAAAGETIQVCSGTYNENLMITKGLTIKSATGIAGDVVVQSSKNSPIVTIREVEDVTIQDLTIDQNDNNQGALSVSSYSQNITLKNLIISSNADGIYTSGDNGHMEFVNLNIKAGGNGITAGSSINGGLSVVDCEITSQNDGMNLREINDGFRLSGTKLTSAEGRGLFFRGEVNDGTVIENTAITADDTCLEFGKDINNGLSFKTVDLISDNGMGIDLNGNVYGTGFRADGLTIKSKKQGLCLGRASSRVQAKSVIINSSILSKENNAVEAHIPGWNSLAIENSCLTTKMKENYYAFYLKTSGSSTEARITDNCFYAPDVSHLAYASKAGHEFSGNYWDGFYGTTYSVGNVTDNTPQSSCGLSCGGGSSSLSAYLDYPFDECDLSIGISDVSGNGHKASSAGAVVVDEGSAVLCRGITFDGNGDYLTVEDGLAVLQETATLSFWIRTTQVSGSSNNYSSPALTGIEENGGEDDVFWGVLNRSGRIGIGVGNDTITSSTAINDDVYHLVTLTRNAGTGQVQVYIDGDLNASGTLRQGTIGHSFSSFGRVENTKDSKALQYLNADIDELQIFSSVLSANDIKGIYDNYVSGLSWDGSGRSCSSCREYCFSDDFDRDSLGDSWTIIKQDNFTPQISNGKLILTSSQGYISSGVTLKGSYPSQDNYVEIEFEHNAYGGNGADGVVLVLSDASVAPVAGAYGGSLGYANRTREDGFAGGWLGFGLDEFGNFSNPTEGRNGGSSQGRVHDAIAVRGHGDTQNDYQYITGTSSLKIGIDNPSSPSPAPSYHYRFSIDMRDDSTLLKVERDTGNGYSTVIDWTDVTQTETPPDNFRVSFTASTGASNNIHSIDDFTINAQYCGTIGEGEIDHFLFKHDGQGLTCAAEMVTLIACANSDCSQVYTGDIQVQLPDLGWLDGTIQTLTFDESGQVTLKLKHTTAETVSLGVIVSTPDASSVTQCTGGSPGSCDLTFYDSGFLIDVDDGRSCSDLAGTIQAVRSDETSEQCVGMDSFAETKRAVGFWFGYQQPASGNVVPWLEGKKLDQTSPGTAVDLDFDAKAQAAFSLSYRDAGSLTLSARYDDTDDDAGLVMTGSTSAPFVVAPDHFVVTSSLNNSTTTGTPKIAAGDTFDVTVQAVCGDGTVTENFAWPTNLTIDDSKPTSAGVLSNGSLLATEFEDGVAAPNDLSYSEVGNITLQALAKDYLSSGMEISGTSKTIGRFHPHHFSVEANPPTLSPGCTTFSYLGQPLAYVDAPQLTISARNAAGGVTTNYTGSWWHLGDIDESYVDANAAAASVTIDDSLAGHSPETTDSSATTPGKVGVTFTGPLSYQKPVGLNVAPFNADLSLQFDINDGDALYEGGNPYSLDIAFDPAEADEIRHGRLVLSNTHGSELLPLSMPITVEYFNGKNFVVNDADSCTTLVLSKFAFDPSPKSIANANGLTGVANGRGSLDWTSPAYPVGSVDVKVDLSTGPYWLQYDWDGDGSEDDPPAARATFGIYKGSERIIYLRETTWH